MDYARYLQAQVTPQSEPVSGKNMSANNAGGYTFKVDKWDQLDRFLILGTEGGTYYVGERKLTTTNFDALEACMNEDAKRVIDRAVELSVSGRAFKNDPALFVLAKACSDKKHANVRSYAMSKLPELARTGTHLFHFVSFAKAFRGWGRAFKKGVSEWYSNKDVSTLAYQLVKYKQRDGWSHRDLLRLAHVKPDTPIRGLLYQKVAHPEISLPRGDDKGLEFFRIASDMAVETSPEKAAKLIREYNLPRECVNTQLLNDRAVWEALLEKMPMTALIRNLGKLSSLGMTEQNSDNTKKIVQQLVNKTALKKARIHPIAVLAALNVYKLGNGIRGSLSWNVNRDIVDALNDAFYAAFDNIEPTNKRYMLALDVSGSMFGNSVNGIAGLDAATAAAAMAMVTMRSEKDVILKAFTSSSGGYGGRWGAPASYDPLSGINDLGISRRMMLDQILGVIRDQPFGGTDCSLPMRWATHTKTPVDAFIVYTDNETWAGNIHPFQALNEYRQAMGIDAKLVVAGVSANDVSIADPSDKGMLDVVGFDASVPQVINNFVLQR